jgi:hypothetical protein
MKEALRHVTKNICVIILFIIVLSCDTSHNVESPDKKYFLKYYGEDGDQRAVDMVVNSDGTFLLLGKTMSGTQGIFIVKADAEGKIMWQKNLGTSTDDPKDIELSIDGSHYVILSDFEKSPSNTDIKLLRIDGEGNKMDSVTYGTVDSGEMYGDHANSVTPLSDGGFIVTGYADYDYNAFDQVNRSSSIFHFRFTSNLSPFDQTNWENYYGSGVINAGVKVYERGDSLYVFGYTDEYSAGNNNEHHKLMLLYYGLNQIGTSTNPEYLGDVITNGGSDTNAKYVLKVPASLIDGYLIVSTTVESPGSSKLRVSKLRDPLKFKKIDDSYFDKEIFGSKTLSGVYASPSVVNSSGYLILANETQETGQTDIMLAKIDQSGDEQWSVDFGSDNNDQAAAVAELPDGKIIVLCTIETIVQSKMALMKLNSKGQLLN